MIKLLDAIAFVAPRWAAEYSLARQHYDASRLYEAVAPNNQWRPISGSNLDGDALVTQAGTRLREMARHLEENHDIAVGVFDDLVNNTVGAAGVSIDPMVRARGGTLHEDVNARLSLLWDEFSEAFESTGELPRSEVERIVARRTFVDGEMFTRLVRASTFPYQTRVNMVVDLLEADFCPFDLHDREKGITNGIRRNQWGAPRGYFFYREHPGHAIVGGGGALAQLLQQTKEVNAGSVLHTKLAKRLKQARGVSVMHAVIGRLRDIKDYEESERISAKVAADMTGFIERTSDFQGTIVNTDLKRRELRMNAGAIFELMPGEKVGSISHDSPSSALEPVRNAMLRAVGAGTGTRFSSIARNYNGTYSAQRQELVEGTVAYRALFSYLVGRWHKPVYRAFIDTVTLGGLLRLPNNIDRETLYKADFRAPALPWIDPKKEADAWAILVENQLESRRGIARLRGRDPDALFLEIEEEKARGFGIEQKEDPPSSSAEDLDDDELGDEVEERRGYAVNA